jgi:CRP-like cAMP-binding protein
MKVVARNSKSKRKSKQKLAFNVQAFLDSAGVARRVEEFQKSQTIYSQGNPAKTVMYIQEGGVKLSVVNDVGKEAVLAILGPDDFFGEGGLAGQPLRMGTATPITPTTILCSLSRPGDRPPSDPEWRGPPPQRVFP